MYEKPACLKISYGAVCEFGAVSLCSVLIKAKMVSFTPLLSLITVFNTILIEVWLSCRSCSAVHSPQGWILAEIISFDIFRFSERRRRLKFRLSVGKRVDSVFLLVVVEPI